MGTEHEDGKSGKLTLSILLAENLIEPGEGVLSIDYLGQSFKGRFIYDIFNWQYITLLLLFFIRKNIMECNVLQ